MDDNKVTVLLEDLRTQFRTFGDGLQMVNAKIDKVDQKVDKLEHEVSGLKNEVIGLKHEVSTLSTENRQEHQQLSQMIKELDTEVVQIKRVK